MANETPLPCGRRGWTLLVAVALAAAALTTGIVPGIPAPAAHADEVTASQNDLRDGWDQGETGLTPAVLGSGTSMGVPTIGCRCAVCASSEAEELTAFCRVRRASAKSSSSAWRAAMRISCSPSKPA